MKNKLSSPKKYRLFFMAFLLVLPVALLLWFTEGEVIKVLWGVLSGSLFRSPWHPVHAGSVMDQPTIGKWYFWTGVFSGIWLICIISARGFVKFGSRFRKIYTVAVCMSAPLYVSMLTMPFFWNVQYVNAMGFTFRRKLGLACGIWGYLMLVAFPAFLIWRSYRTSKKLEQEPDPVG